MNRSFKWPILFADGAKKSLTPVPYNGCMDFAAGRGMRFGLTGGMIPRTVKRMFDQRSETRREAGRQSAMLAFRRRSHTVQLVNVSSSGAMVICPQIPHIGEHVSLQLLDRGSVDGYVRWVRDGCIGVSFVTPADHGEE